MKAKKTDSSPASEADAVLAAAVATLASATRDGMTQELRDRLEKMPYTQAAGGLDKILHMAAQECVGHEDAAMATQVRACQLCGLAWRKAQAPAAPAAS